MRAMPDDLTARPTAEIVKALHATCRVYGCRRRSDGTHGTYSRCRRSLHVLTDELGRRANPYRGRSLDSVVAEKYPDGIPEVPDAE
jgi:hypothetical protein